MTGAAFVVGVALLAPDAQARPTTTTGRCTAAAVAHRRRGGAGRRPRRRRHRRRPGQDHDRGAADEDGRRRGALRHRGSPPRSRSSPSARLDGTEEMFADQDPGLLSFLATGTTDGEVEGINDLRSSTRRPTARTRARRTTPPATTPRSSRSPTGRFRLMIGLGPGRRCGRRLVLWATRRGRAPHAAGWCCGRRSRCRSCRCSRTRSAGSSPRWAASPGSSSA